MALGQSRPSRSTSCGCRGGYTMRNCLCFCGTPCTSQAGSTVSQWLWKALLKASELCCPELEGPFPIIGSYCCGSLTFQLCSLHLKFICQHSSSGTPFSTYCVPGTRGAGWARLACSSVLEATYWRGDHLCLDDETPIFCPLTSETNNTLSFLHFPSY